MGRIGSFFRSADRRIQDAADDWMLSRLRAGGTKRGIVSTASVVTACLVTIGMIWLALIGYPWYVAPCGAVLGIVTVSNFRVLAVADLQWTARWAAWTRLALAIVVLFQASMFFWLPPYAAGRGVTLGELAGPNAALILSTLGATLCYTLIATRGLPPVDSDS